MPAPSKNRPPKAPPAPSTAAKAPSNAVHAFKEASAAPNSPDSADAVTKRTRAKAKRPKLVGVGSGNNQKGGMNALKNGSRLSLTRFYVGELPRTMVCVKREALRYRRAIEAEVLRTHNEISLTHAHAIDTASAATMMAGVNRWLMRNRLDKMSVSDIRGCMGDVVKAKGTRDAAIRLLNLDAPPPDPWTQLDAKIIAVTGVENDDDTAP